jgi:hypothetical protein
VISINILIINWTDLIVVLTNSVLLELIYNFLIHKLPITVSARSKAYKQSSLARMLRSWFESHSRHGCLCALRRADSPSKESYRLRIGSRNCKNRQGPKKGGRARIIIIHKYCLTLRVTCSFCAFFNYEYETLSLINV